MSVHTMERRQAPPAYDVRWRSDGGQWSRRFEDPSEAEAFDAAMRARLAYDRAKAAYDLVPERWREAVDAELAA